MALDQVNIFKGGAIIDIVVNREKFDSYKTERGKRNFVHRKLSDVFVSLENKKIGELTIRDVSITSNHFWGEDFCEVPNLSYCLSNQVEQIEDSKIVLRFFQVDVLGLGYRLDKELMDDLFFTVSTDKFHLHISDVKLS